MSRRTEARRLTDEQIQQLRKDPNVRQVNRNRISFTYEFRMKMYERWVVNPSATAIRQFLTDEGYNSRMFNCAFVKNIHNNFKRHGRPTNGRRTSISTYSHRNTADEISKLLATGKFVKTGNGITFSQQFVDELLNAYPEQSIEEGIRKAGIDPQIVGYQRIYLLECRFNGGPSTSAGSRTHIHYSDETIARYSDHPYVKRITRKQFVFTESFYAKAASVNFFKINDILRLFEINPDDLSISTRASLYYRIYNHKDHECRSADYTAEFRKLSESAEEQAVRIQLNIMKALEEHLCDEMKDFREQILPSLSCRGRKFVCQAVNTWHQRHPDRTITELLEAAGIPRTSFYTILRDKNYGKAEQLKEKQEKKDFQDILKTYEYGGFKKGSRQIYMDMPDVIGKHMGLGHIRRLMKKFGLSSGIRTVKNHDRKSLKDKVKPNLLKRQFKLNEPGEVTLSDVTYLTIAKSDSDQKGIRAYASAAKDPATNRLIDLSVSLSNDLNLVERSVTAAGECAHPGSIFHTDQGVLYLTPYLQNKIKALGLRQSMSKRGNCWDNAPQESFFGHFKDEVDFSDCKTIEELQNLCDRYKDYYNNHRRQWNLNRMTPAEFENWLNSLNDEDYEAYHQKRIREYEAMKVKAAQEAVRRATTLGV
ncbi:MAG: IS3 family transposase [Solobacterium sp.]|nr:IS3 family transposase [Solobacterium sp.]MCH4048543.1 IS3 family transposase [Solobacterium sp.]MCH4074607.1 IS3 family transposase [Solobacterium sp.]